MDPMEGLRAAMAAVDAYHKERGIFQGRFGFGQAPALVVIDMAYGWTDPAYAGGSARLDSAIAALQQAGPRGQVEAAALLRAVAGQAALPQDRGDAVGEQRRLGRRSRRGEAEQGQQEAGPGRHDGALPARRGGQSGQTT